METTFDTTFCKCVQNIYFICSNYNNSHQDIQQSMCENSCLYLKKKITRLHLQPQTKDMLLIWNFFALYDLTK